MEKIIVHEATKVNGVQKQEVEIHLNFIGRFDLPEQEETSVRKSRKKRRHEMTEEQREQQPRRAQDMER